VLVNIRLVSTIKLLFVFVRWRIRCRLHSPCEGGFRRIYPLRFCVPHFSEFRGPQRTSLALRVGSSGRTNRTKRRTSPRILRVLWVTALNTRFD
jgi:hypothetical protein